MIYLIYEEQLGNLKFVRLEIQVRVEVVVLSLIPHTAAGWKLGHGFYVLVLKRISSSFGNLSFLLRPSTD